MTRFAITWAGTVAKSLPAQTPADALYYVWARFREEFVGGLVVTMEAGGRGVSLAQISFQARMTREIEAEDATEAVRAMLYDDRLPGSVLLSDLHVEELDRQPRLELVQAAA